MSRQLCNHPSRSRKGKVYVHGRPTQAPQRVASRNIVQRQVRSGQVRPVSFISVRISWRGIGSQVPVENTGTAHRERDSSPSFPTVVLQGRCALDGGRGRGRGASALCQFVCEQPLAGGIRVCEKGARVRAGPPADSLIQTPSLYLYLTSPYLTFLHPPNKPA